MKKDIHPENYRPVIFKDTASGERFLISSTIETDKTDKWEDGNEYPFTQVEVSSSSHPFYTGQDKVLDTAGRVEKFKARQQKAHAARGANSKKSEKKLVEKKKNKSTSGTEGSISI